MRLENSRIFALIAFGFFASGLKAGELETFDLDPVRTRVVFAVEHAGLSKAMGAIFGSTGTLRFDRDDWRSAQLEVTVPLSRLEMGDAKVNAAVLSSTLLDGKRHPAARFVSTKIEPVDADHAKVCGDLTLRGVTKPLCMDVTLNALKRHPLPPFHRTAGFSATATLNRKDFGIGAWPTVIGATVNLLIEVEAVRAKDAGSATPAEPVAIPPAEEDATDREPEPPEPASGDSKPAVKPASQPAGAH
ncbi:MAG TPA: YceI family protein [Lysobacter sp.]|jgi:polyisoprenoid-binding protein YceI|nr:YceI family protein [Lysobacter sp.]